LLALKQIRFSPSAIYAPIRKNILFPLFSRNAARLEINDETLSNYQCYLLVRQFARIKEIIEKRRLNAAFYSEKLKDVVTVPSWENGAGDHTYSRYTIQADKREKLLDYLLDHGIESDKMYNYSLDEGGRCSNSVAVSRRSLNIPVHQSLTSKDMVRVVELIHRFYGQRTA